jgi:hypothetical protein
MKRLGIMLIAALLAIAPGYASAQQSAEKGQSPAQEKAKPYQFPKNQNPEEYQFPEEQNPKEYKFPEEQPGETNTSPAIQLEGQKGKGEQAQALKTYSPKEKRAYLNKTATDVAAIQKRIDSLNVKEQYKSLQRRNANRMIMVDLQKRALTARKQLAALEKAPEMVWSAEKVQMDRAMGDVQKAFSDALEFFEETGNSPQGPKVK